MELDGDSKFLFVGFKFSGWKFSCLKCLKPYKFGQLVCGFRMGLWFSRVLGFNASITLRFLLSIFSPLFIEKFSLVSLYTLEDLMYNSEIADV